MDQEVDDLLYGNFEEPVHNDHIVTKNKTAEAVPNSGVTIQPDRESNDEPLHKLQSENADQSMIRGRLLDPNLSKQGKMFIGGLSWETTDVGLRNYMKAFGEIEDVLIMKDSFTNRSRGFAFLTFRDPASIDHVLQTDHYIDGKKVHLVINKKIDPKRAVPKEEYERAEKVFVGGVHADITDRDFREFFETFGNVTEATVMFDRNTGRPRGFGFVTFANWAGLQKVLDAQATGGIFLLGKRMEVKPASLRHQPLIKTYPGMMTPSHMGMPLPGYGVGNRSPEAQRNRLASYGHTNELGDDRRGAVQSGSVGHETDERRGEKHRDRNGRYDREDDRDSLKNGKDDRDDDCESVKSGRSGREIEHRGGNMHRGRNGRYDRRQRRR